MKGPESQTALVPAQSTALVRKAAAKLAKRGLGDLWLLESAEEWFERAKTAKSQNQLIEFFECLQRTVALDPEHRDGLDLLGMAYHDGIGTLRDQVAAVEYFRRAAERGHAEAQYHLGLVYDYGHGVARDQAGGAAWERKAAEQGHTGAQYRLAGSYYWGNGVPKSRFQAAEWYRKAAEQGHAASQYELGKMYHHAEGIAKNLFEAAEWYRKAANLGYRDAQFSLSYTIEEGGAILDRLEAMAWLHKAAEGGYGVAQRCLGDRYFWGDGVPRDRTQGMAWYLKATEQRDCGAIYKLARMYAEGEGLEVSQDLAKAALWYRKAVDSGCDHDYGEATRWLEKHTETGEGA